jgi:hypothetical protein
LGDAGLPDFITTELRVALFGADRCRRRTFRGDASQKLVAALHDAEAAGQGPRIRFGESGVAQRASDGLEA